MTEKEYRSHPAVSRSELWRIRESPERFKYFREHPPEPTPALIFGQLFHKMALEPASLWDEFAVAPNVDRRTRDGKAEFADFLKRSEGRTIVTAEMLQQADAMCAALFEDEFCQKLLDGERETPYFWIDQMTGELCKCRTDVTVDIGGAPLVVDLKSTNDASTEGFMKSAVKYGYHFQAAMYTEGVNAITGCEHDFVFIAVEKDPPHCVNVLRCDEAFMTLGYDTFRELIGTYHYCRETDNWYGYMGRDRIINTLSLPPWLAKSVE